MARPDERADDEPLDAITSIISLFTYISSQNSQLKFSPAVIAAHPCFALPWIYEWAQVDEYIERLRQWIVCDTESYVVAVCLIKKFEAMKTIPAITQRSFHRIFLMALLLAVKYMEDETLTNSDFAKVGCVSLKEINAMELTGLLPLKFNCTVTPAEYMTCKLELSQLHSYIQKRTSKPSQRGTDEPISLLSLLDEMHRASRAPHLRINVRPMPPEGKSERIKTLSRRGDGSNGETPKARVSVGMKSARGATKPRNVLTSAFASATRKSVGTISYKSRAANSVPVAEQPATRVLTSHIKARQTYTPKAMLRQDSI